MWGGGWRAEMSPSHGKFGRYHSEFVGWSEHWFSKQETRLSAGCSNPYRKEVRCMEKFMGKRKTKSNVAWDEPS